MSAAMSASSRKAKSLRIRRGYDADRALPIHLQDSIGQLQDKINLISQDTKLNSALKVRLTQLDQSILAKAFRGELVPQDPRDEPASELLARIRTTRESAAAKRAIRR